MFVLCVSQFFNYSQDLGNLRLGDLLYICVSVFFKNTQDLGNLRLGDLLYICVVLCVSQFFNYTQDLGNLRLGDLLYICVCFCVSHVNYNNEFMFVLCVTQFFKKNAQDLEKLHIGDFLCCGCSLCEAILQEFNKTRAIHLYYIHI